MSSSKPSAGIVGLGLIGGSIARRLLASGWEVRWSDPGVDRADVTGELPDLLDASWEEIVGSDIVILATPSDIAIDLLRQANFGDSLVTSVCSVMRPLDDAAQDRLLRFVAGHPMAGRETSGWVSSDEDLFSGRPWFVGEAHPFLDRMILDCGAEPHVVEPSEHDRYVALTSHLPQLLSSAVAAVIKDEAIPPAFVGSGLRTFLRLAGSRWEMWESIIDLNGEPIGVARKKLDDRLDDLQSGKGRAIFDKANSL